MFSLYYCLQQINIIDLVNQNLGLKATVCQSNQFADLSPQQTSSKMREVKNIEFKNPGGGGGGATAIFTVNIISSVKK